MRRRIRFSGSVSQGPRRTALQSEPRAVEDQPAANGEASPAADPLGRTGSSVRMEDPRAWRAMGVGGVATKRHPARVIREGPGGGVVVGERGSRMMTTPHHSAVVAKDSQPSPAPMADVRAPGGRSRSWYIYADSDGNRMPPEPGPSNHYREGSPAGTSENASSGPENGRQGDPPRPKALAMAKYAPRQAPGCENGTSQARARSVASQTGCRGGERHPRLARGV